eukprot:TRINITY_DN449_c0_g2_i2.p1 TRINITY_DN449_c0_g2~~TRINITY_DN449_c0_g2_i2.p1  ORF type:complete len:491 (-),score=134.20 TRINITY_DN449_c0_g2_i2:118-1590(-)
MSMDLSLVGGGGGSVGYLDSINNAAANSPLSTAQKAQYVTQFLEKHIHRKLVASESRVLRRKQLNEYMSKIDDKQKKEVEKKFVLDGTRSLRLSRRRISVDDFRTVAVIGRGAFSEVRLVRKKDSKELFAMKIMEKEEMLLRGQVEHILQERKLMSKVMRMYYRNIGRGLQSQPTWLVPQLHWAFQDAKNLYLVMDFLAGGDLVNVLMKHDKLTEDQTRFYIAEIALALNFIHELGYAHRDLKPDNILLERSGHIRIADFGLCKKIFESNSSSNAYSSGEEDDIGLEDEKNSSVPKHMRLKSVVGSPDYCAPELVESIDGYGPECDYWSLGCIVFECILGYPPFYCDDADPMATWKKIIDWKNHLYIPAEANVSPEARDLIEKLICEAPKRLTFDKLRGHPFFKSINWDTIRKSDPPIVPRVENETDTQNFDEFHDIKITTLPEIRLYTHRMAPHDIAFAEFDFRKPDVPSHSNSSVMNLFYLPSENRPL